MSFSFLSNWKSCASLLGGMFRFVTKGTLDFFYALFSSFSHHFALLHCQSAFEISQASFLLSPFNLKSRTFSRLQYDSPSLPSLLSLSMKANQKKIQKMMMKGVISARKHRQSESTFEQFQVRLTDWLTSFESYRQWPIKEISGKRVSGKELSSAQLSSIQREGLKKGSDFSAKHTTERHLHLDGRTIEPSLSLSLFPPSSSFTWLFVCSFLLACSAQLGSVHFSLVQLSSVHPSCCRFTFRFLIGTLCFS